MQSTRPIHQGYHAAVRGGNHHICDGKRTQRSQKQRTLPHTHNHTTGYKNWKSQQAKRILDAVDEEMVEILTRIRENEKAYEKGQEAARKQARTTSSA